MGSCPYLMLWAVSERNSLGDQGPALASAHNLLLLINLDVKKAGGPPGAVADSQPHGEDDAGQNDGDVPGAVRAVRTCLPDGLLPAARLPRHALRPR